MIDPSQGIAAPRGDEGSVWPPELQKMMVLEAGHHSPHMLQWEAEERNIATSGGQSSVATASCVAASLSPPCDSSQHPVAVELCCSEASPECHCCAGAPSGCNGAHQRPLVLYWSFARGCNGAALKLPRSPML